NTAARGELLRYYLSQSDCESVAVEDTLVERLDEVLSGLPAVRRVMVVRTSGAAAVAAMPHAGEREVADFAERVAVASEAARGVEDVKCSDLLMLAYTSGTTGPSKGSMLSHAAALTYG